MAHVSDPAFLVLHGLKLKGFAEADAVAAVVGLPADHVREALASHVDAGRAMRREGRISGFALTPAGRSHHGELLAADVAASGAADTVRGHYEEFLVLNRDLLAVCTAWQVKDLEANVLNDHTDPAYDAEVIGRLRAVHVGVSPVCGGLTGSVARYGAYHPRFEVALAKVEAGEQEWFARPIIDSYHTVWMELHEDLLASLGIDRASEPSH